MTSVEQGGKAPVFEVLEGEERQSFRRVWKGVLGREDDEQISQSQSTGRVLGRGEYRAPLIPSLCFAFQSWTHNIQREKEFLRKLVKARVITDLTSGI